MPDRHFVAVIPYIFEVYGLPGISAAVCDRSSPLVPANWLVRNEFRSLPHSLLIEPFQTSSWMAARDDQCHSLIRYYCEKMWMGDMEEMRREPLRPCGVFNGNRLSLDE